jgi:hypothetical protein
MYDKDDYGHIKKETRELRRSDRALPSRFNPQHHLKKKVKRFLHS